MNAVNSLHCGTDKLQALVVIHLKAVYQPNEDWLLSCRKYFTGRIVMAKSKTRDFTAWTDDQVDQVVTDKNQS